MLSCSSEHGRMPSVRAQPLSPGQELTFPSSRPDTCCFWGLPQGAKRLASPLRITSLLQARHPKILPEEAKAMLGQVKMMGRSCKP
jgi:hypothetical protein